MTARNALKSILNKSVEPLQVKPVVIGPDATALTHAGLYAGISKTGSVTQPCKIWNQQDSSPARLNWANLLHFFISVPIIQSSLF